MNYEKFIKKTIPGDEKIIKVFSLGQSYLILSMSFWLFLSIIFSIPYIYLGILVFLGALFYHFFYLRIANIYILTNKRMVIKKGWLSVYTVNIDYEKITDISVKEPFVYRILTCTGDLIVNTAGTDKKQTILRKIDNPHNLKNSIDDIKNREKREFYQPEPGY